MNVLTVGQKIKKIRKEISLHYHKVTQAELAGNGISTSSIGHLEKGDLKINNHLARVIIENASAIAKKNGKEFNYTVEWLMEDREQEVYSLVRTHIIELKSNPTAEQFESIKVKLDFLCKTEKIHSNQLFIINDCYTKYYEKRDVNLAKASLLKMLEIANKTNNLSQQLYVIKRITYISSLVERWEDIITWGGIAISLSYKKYISLFMKKIYFNMAMAYMALNNFKECTKLLELLETKHELEKGEKFDVDILKANCFKEMGNFNLSDEILKELLRKSKTMKDSYRSVLVYVNMAKLRCKMNDHVAVDLINKAINIDMPKDLKFKYKEAEFNYNALEIYIKFKQSFDFINNVFETLYNTTLFIKEYDLQFKSIVLMINYGISNNNMMLIKSLLHKLKDLKISTNKKSLVYFKTLNYLYTNKDKDFESELINGFKIANEVEF